MRLDREETRVIRVAVEALILVLVQKAERAVLDNSRLEKQKNMVRWGIGSFVIVPCWGCVGILFCICSRYCISISWRYFKHSSSELQGRFCVGYGRTLPSYGIIFLCIICSSAGLDPWHASGFSEQYF